MLARTSESPQSLANTSSLCLQTPLTEPPPAIMGYLAKLGAIWKVVECSSLKNLSICFPLGES